METFDPDTRPSAPTIISSADLEEMKNLTTQALLSYKDAQLAELQKQNFILRIRIKYSLSESAQINNETGEVFYRTK